MPTEPRPDVQAIGAEATAAMRRCRERLVFGGSISLARKLEKHEKAWTREVKAELRAQEQIALSKASASLDQSVLLAVDMPIRTVSEPNNRDHWTKKHRERGDVRPFVKMVMRAHARTKGVKIPLPCNVRLTRIGPGTLDDDNLRAALKAVRDGVADWLDTDDSASGGVSWLYGKQETSKLFGVRVEVSAA